MAVPEQRLAEIADLEMWYPQFGTIYETARPGMRQAAIDNATCMFEDECLWGCSLLMAHVHLTAHMLIVNQRVSGGDGTKSGDKGKKISMKMGPVSTTFEASTATGGTGELSTTASGQAFMRLRDELGPMGLEPGGRGCDDFDGIGGCF